MSQRHDNIINFMSKITRGVVQLTWKQADRIIEIVEHKDPTVIVNKYRYDSNNDKYIPIQSFEIDLEKAKERIHKLTPVKQWKCFYLYQIPDLAFEFYSVSNNLFESER